MSECKASKRARKNNYNYQIRQTTIYISDNDLRQLETKLKQYLKENHQ